MNGTARTFVIRNTSTDPELSVDALAAICSGITGAFNGPFASAWGCAPGFLVVGDAGARVEIVDDLDDPNDVAYHDFEGGLSRMRIGACALRAYRPAPFLDALSIAIAHELFEAEINPTTERYAEAPGKPRRLAFEVVDPVQGDSWRCGTIAIPNFVLPSYFDACGRAPFDLLGRLAAPFSCDAGGYQVWEDGSQTFGESVTESVRAHVRRHGRIASRPR